MGNTLNPQSWSTTANDNDDADAGINWLEGQDPGTVNNSGRGVMAGGKRYILDKDGYGTVGGTANALTITTQQAIDSAHLVDGYRIGVWAASANTSATVTINVDVLGTKTIKRADGSALAVGSIQAGMFLDLAYEAGAGVFCATNIPPALASFSAHKNGTNQTISTTSPTKITFTTEVFDNGGYLTASGRWTPPAGIVQLTSTVTVSAITTDTLIIHVYKNGASYKYFRKYASSSIESATVAMIDSCNGTDYYEIYFQTGTDASYTVDGSTVETFFMGSMF